MTVSSSQRRIVSAGLTCNQYLIGTGLRAPKSHAPHHFNNLTCGHIFNVRSSPVLNPNNCILMPQYFLRRSKLRASRNLISQVASKWSNSSWFATTVDQGITEAEVAIGGVGALIAVSVLIALFIGG